MVSSFKKVERKKAYLLIVEQISEMIESEELKPGERLPSERDLALKFGVARPTAREALSALEALGFIDIRLGEGSFVVGVPQNRDTIINSLSTQASPFELLEARQVLEPAIASVATMRACKADIKKLSDILSKMKMIAKEEKRVDPKLDEEFHTTIARCSKNIIFEEITISICSLMKGDIWKVLTRHNNSEPGRIEKYIEQHEEILNAFINRKRSDCYLAMLNHLEDVSRDLHEENFFQEDNSQDISFERKQKTARS